MPVTAIICSLHTFSLPNILSIFKMEPKNLQVLKGTSLLNVIKFVWYHLGTNHKKPLRQE